MEENKNNNKPKHFRTFKILALVFILVGVTLIILGTAVFGDDFMPAMPLFIPGIFITFFSFPVFILGFQPEIAKMNAKSARYIQQQTIEEQTDMANTGAEIHSDAITTVAKSIKEGLEDSIYCKHCGAKIDADSRFCKKCGKEQ